VIVAPHHDLPHTQGRHFKDLGAVHFDRRPKDIKAKHLVTQLAKLGFDTTVTLLSRAA
jgi:hypothetical protein